MTDPWGAPPPHQQQPYQQQPYQQPYGPPPPQYPYVPPPRYAPPARRRLDKPVVALTVAITLLLTANVVTVMVKNVTAGIDRLEDERRQLAAADQAFDDALNGPADTATVSPAPDGSRRYDSPAVEGDQHAFHLTLPKGWEGRHVGVREDSTSFSDSILLAPGTGVAMTIDRIDLGLRTGSPEFERALRRGVSSGADAVTVTSRLRQTTVGDGETAYELTGRAAHRGDAQRVRITVFDHGGETFRIDQIGPEADWPKRVPAIDRILRSWRWG